MKIIFSFAVAFILAVPSTSFAYQVLSTGATKLTDNAYLFSISYQLGFEKLAVVAPIGAIRGDTGVSTAPLLTYTILEDGEISSVGTTGALVLSNADIVDAKYQVPKGEARLFTFVTLLVVPDGYTIDEASLQVTGLPFTLIADDKVIPNGLSTGELSYYRTDSIE